EFKALHARSPRGKDNPNAAPGIFDRLDTNKDGSLSLAEFRALLPAVGGNEKPGTPPGPIAIPKAAAGFNDSPTAEQAAFFEKKIRPAFVDPCYTCHAATAEKLKGGLALDTKDGTRKGGDSGACISPGKPDRSLLITAIRYKDEHNQ